MIVAGIDPGSRNCGYAAFEVSGGDIRLLECGNWGLLQGNAKRSLGERLERLHENALIFLRRFNPEVIGFEKAVSFKSVPSAHVLSEARGVLRLAMHQALESAEERVVELSPTRVKSISTGSGASNKAAVQKMLMLRFQHLSSELGEEALKSDAFDALAIAWASWIDHKERHGSKVRASIRPST